jgi:hypothetical protein
MDSSGPVAPLKNGENAPTPMGRVLLLIVGICCVFCMVVAVLLRLMPGPRREVDYLVIGGLATLVSMVGVFLVLITTWLRGEDIFFKRRKPE